MSLLVSTSQIWINVVRYEEHMCYVVMLSCCLGQRVYWCDGERIESVAYNGSNRKLLVYDSNWKFHGITLVGDKLYYTDQT